MNLKPGTDLINIKINKVFIKFCTNFCIEDLESAFKILKNKKISPNVTVIVVHGSGLVKKSEKEGWIKFLSM